MRRSAPGAPAGLNHEIRSLTGRSTLFPRYSVKEDLPGKRRVSARIVWAVAIAAILLDQGTKILVESMMDLGQSGAVIGDLFRLTYIKNAGGAFGIFMGGGWFYFLASVAAVAMILFYLRRLSPGLILPRLALAMILGGALGNLIDRIRSGVVTDFLDFGIGNTRWPVFNLADAFITVGVVLFFISMMRTHKEGAEDHTQTDRSPADS
jgi:signal peptidase II